MYAPVERPRMRGRRLHMYFTDPKTTSEKPQDHELTDFHWRGRPGGTVDIATSNNYFFHPPEVAVLISLDQ